MCSFWELYGVGDLIKSIFSSTGSASENVAVSRFSAAFLVKWLLYSSHMTYIIVHTFWFHYQIVGSGLVHMLLLLLPA